MSPHLPSPKIELHVHLEGTVRPPALLAIARRNGVHLPADVDTEEDLAQLYTYRDFAHFLELWSLTTCAIRTERDFREVVVGYAMEAAAHGAAYLEGIFSPAERVSSEVGWDQVFNGFCDGAEEARERTDVEVRLTCDAPRNRGLDLALQTARYCVSITVARSTPGTLSHTLAPSTPSSSPRLLDRQAARKLGRSWHCSRQELSRSPLDPKA